MVFKKETFKKPVKWPQFVFLPKQQHQILSYQKFIFQDYFSAYFIANLIHGLCTVLYRTSSQLRSNYWSWTA